MKTKILLLSIVTLSLAILAPVAIGQTNVSETVRVDLAAKADPAEQPPIPTQASFFQTAQSYFTSFNPALESTFRDQRGEFAIGVDAIQGGDAPLANSLRLSYDAFGKVSAEVLVRDSGITGFLLSAQAGPAINFVIHDAKLTLYGHVGHRQDEASDNPEKIFGEIGVRIQKALTEHTFAGVGMGVQFPGNSTRTFSAFTGFTF